MSPQKKLRRDKLSDRDDPVTPSASAYKIPIMIMPHIRQVISIPLGSFNVRSIFAAKVGRTAFLNDPPGEVQTSRMILCNRYFVVEHAIDITSHPSAHAMDCGIHSRVPAVKCLPSYL
ncbi:hypothetical protein AVEN_203767-1 [Araneus ventricosus]|uniref:Uncharacterized protein n=1 Tax=Araneus ventricosus TaxID=182803 RepID=A0A4Y2ISV0_ARAVE|nr:hypothetical protein AVEN_203767-1 [Araneus ventricosus]